jgi:hypothetical protein
MHFLSPFTYCDRSVINATKLAEQRTFSAVSKVTFKGFS